MIKLTGNTDEDIQNLLKRNAELEEAVKHSIQILDGFMGDPYKKISNAINNLSEVDNNA